MSGRAPLVLVALLLLAAVGPLLAEFLPPGPASLLDPGGAAVAAAWIAVLWALFAWPILARDREVAAILGDGLLLLALAAPFVIGTGWSFGARWPALSMALAVVAGSIVVTGAWLAGPGRSGSLDRWYLAFWIAVVGVIPLANWVLMDFVGMRGAWGFRVSPVLAVRRILLELPGADPLPFLVTGLALLVVASVGGLLRRGAAAALVFVLAGSAAGAELVPELGDRYVPGRPVALRLGGVATDVKLRLPGRWGTTAVDGELVHLPGVEGLRSVEVDGEAVPVAVRPAPAGRLLVALGPVPAPLAEAAASAGFTIARARPGVEQRLGWRDYLSADGVVDPTGLLSREVREALRFAGVPVVEGPADLPGETPLRRPWEEPERVLSAEGLDRMFPPSAGPDPGRARNAFLLLLLFTFVAVALHRFGRRREWAGAGIAGAVTTAAGVAVLGVVMALPALPDWEAAEVSATFGSRTVTVVRVRGLRNTVATPDLREFPLALGRGSEALTSLNYASVPLQRGETRWLVAERAGRVEPRPFDFFLTPEGMAKPGEAALPAGEFLKRHLPGPDGQLVRKLLRIDGSLRHKYGVRIPKPGRLEVLRVE